MFKPFERLGAEFTDVEGTGIGLTLTQKLIGLMDGELSYADNEGGELRSTSTYRSVTRCLSRWMTSMNLEETLRLALCLNSSKLYCISRTTPQI